MKVGDLVVCPRAYGAKGIILAIREQMYHSDLVCDVWLYELDDAGGKTIVTFMKTQIEVINGRKD
jgi:hypothetical protein